MGNSASSKGQPELTQEQSDLAYLGDRYPFGDDELHHLYEAYQSIFASEDVERTSFLEDWAVHCAKEEDRAERRTLIQVVERNILPVKLGNRMYEAGFLADGDTSVYAKNPEATATTPSQAVDAYTRRARLERFLEGITNSGRRGTKPAVTVLFDTCDLVPAQSETNVDTPFHLIRAREIVDMGYRLALATAFLRSAQLEDGGDMADYIPLEDDSASESSLQALANSIVQRGKRRRQRSGLASNMPHFEEELVELEDILEWVDEVAPVFASILPTFLFNVFFPGRKYPPSRTPFSYPRVLSASAFFSLPSCPLLFTFGCLSTSLEGDYYRLYTSAEDGLSFNRLENTLLGYAGPTLLLIRSHSKGVFGAFTASQWKESKDFYGSSDCFLFQMSPVTAVYRPTGNATNYMYCNPTARSRGYDQQAHGIGFGGTVDEPRLFIEETFDNCVAMTQDLTFETGNLLPKSESGGTNPHRRFEIDSLEVWGVGGDEVVQEALGARAAARSVREEGIRRARKVDKAAFLEDFRSGIIDAKAFKHREQIQGRADEDVEHRYKKDYEYEK